MLRLEELRFKNIGRFTETQVIHFDSLGSLVQVDGQNNNTGGSSGAGKTTVFHALDYLLGLPDSLPTTVLQSRLTEEGISVAGRFSWDGTKIWITRSKRTGLQIEIFETLVSGNSDIVEGKLDEIIGMSRKLFKKILHKKQKEGGFFLQFTPKQIYGFLTDCLGLSELRTKLEKIENKIKELTESSSTTASSLESNKAALIATEDAILALGEAPVKDIDVSTISTLKERSDKALQDLRELETRHSIALQALQLEKPSLNVQEFDRKQIKAYEAELRVIREQAEYLNGLELQRQKFIRENLLAHQRQRFAIEDKINQGRRASQEAPKFALEIKKIRESICPTCDQSWTNESAKTKESELLYTLKSLRTLIETGKTAEEELPINSLTIAQLERDLLPIIPEGLSELANKEVELLSLLEKEKKQELEHNRNENMKNRSLMDEFSMKEHELRRYHHMELEQARGNYDINKRVLDSSVVKLRSYEETKRKYDQTKGQLKEKHDLYGNAVKKLSETLEKVTKELEMAEEVKRAIKSYTSRSFDEALALIGDTSTRIIRAIPNMANATIQLEGVKETKDGKVNEEVNAVISMDGEVGIPIKSLSGGERSSVDLAVDLAVIDLVESKTGKGIDLFILDEPFTGLDTVSIEMALEVLKNSSLNKKLVIVDHNPEVKQMVESRLVVVRNGATSSISQIGS